MVYKRWSSSAFVGALEKVVIIINRLTIISRKETMARLLFTLTVALATVRAQNIAITGVPTQKGPNGELIPHCSLPYWQRILTSVEKQELSLSAEKFATCRPTSPTSSTSSSLVSNTSRPWTRKTSGRTTRSPASTECPTSPGTVWLALQTGRRRAGLVATAHIPLSCLGHGIVHISRFGR